MQRSPVGSQGESFSPALPAEAWLTESQLAIQQEPFETSFWWFYAQSRVSVERLGSCRNVARGMSTTIRLNLAGWWWRLERPQRARALGVAALLRHVATLISRKTVSLILISPPVREENNVSALYNIWCLQRSDSGCQGFENLRPYRWAKARPTAFQLGTGRRTRLNLAQTEFLSASCRPSGPAPVDPQIPTTRLLAGLNSNSGPAFQRTAFVCLIRSRWEASNYPRMESLVCRGGYRGEKWLRGGIEDSPALSAMCRKWLLPLC